jgi:hypothetical protein
MTDQRGPRPSGVRGSARSSLVLILVLGLAAPLQGQLRPAAVPWTSLEFGARKMGFSMTANLALGSSAAASAPSLVAPGEGTPLQPTGTVESLRMRTSFVGRNSDATTLFDPTTARAFQQVQIDSGKRQRFRVNRYCEQGVFTLRRTPEKGEEKLPHERWTKASQNWEEYPAWAGEDLLVADASTLFYVAAAAPLARPGDRHQVPVLAKGNLILVELTVLGTQSVKVDYESVAGGTGSRVKRAVDALRVSLDAQHLDPDSTEGDLELMGLQGDVELLLDPETRLPLEFSGRVPVAGKVTVRLVRAEVR